MKRVLFILCFMVTASFVQAQGNDIAPDEFHTKQLVSQQKPIPYPYIRENDIIWTTHLWKTIDSRELFNHFFYFPYDEYITFGKKSLAYILWDAMAAGEIPIYEDDALLIPIDNAFFVERYTRADTIMLEIGYDDDDNEMYETVIKPKYFDGAEVLEYAFREVWFVGKQDTRQDSRRLALAPLKETYREIGGGQADIYLGVLPLFWIPMQHPAVRNLLAHYQAYIDDISVINQPSWDWVFVNQHYNAYITRESNIYERTLSSYLTGTDVLLEAEHIEEKVFDIENEMWEY